MPEGEHGVTDLCGHLIEETGVRLLGHLEGVRSATLDLREKLVHDPHLVLHRVEEVQPDERVRTCQAEVVREVRNRHALIRLEPVLPPPLPEVTTVTAYDLDGRDVGLPEVETCCQDQGVDRGAGTVRRHDGIRLDMSIPLVCRCTLGWVKVR